MNPFKDLSIIVLFVGVVFAQNIPANQIILPKPHDKTGHALDIMVITAPIYNLKLDAGDFVHNQGRFFSKRVQAQKNPSRS